MDLLTNTIKPYAWGSHEALASIQGRPTPSPGPEAELWTGAHPAAPSALTRQGKALRLDSVIAQNPQRELGSDSHTRFGARLPFLMKLLAAEKALSIQVHPNREQAAAGFAAQAEKGGECSYTDEWPKPEILCALTRFEALAGFRDPHEAADVLAALELDALSPLIDLLRKEATPQSLRAALQSILTWPEHSRAGVLSAVTSSCAQLSRQDTPHAPAYGAVVRLANDHPGDAGLLASLLLRHTVLAPGQAIYMPAGGLHAYLEGVGVELLASSDNVLRAGLTTKRVDIPELLRVVDPAVDVPILNAVPANDAAGLRVYETPTSEFRLHQASLHSTSVDLPSSGPRIVLCVAGSAILHRAEGGVLTLTTGESAFLPDADGAVNATGNAELFIATVGRSAPTAG